ncbi:hypothetical protein Nepgr_016435 [Nepenthes gracilis]|uniref:Uncharacterized protein n=1 Tax=Nepenthes gracilis TaxID=150966 RepID=A0AAD3XS33_NEPGR|nr:hypothetical protein Nepgr_016435 [Nepenthes gracilis]
MDCYGYSETVYNLLLVQYVMLNQNDAGWMQIFNAAILHSEIGGFSSCSLVDMVEADDQPLMWICYVIP